MGGGRFRALDGLRGFAALLVVFYHITAASIFKALPLVTNGAIAVDLFFMLSGFVIACAYEGRIATARSMGRFLALRFFRIYPLHLFVLLVFLAREVLKLYFVQHGGVVNQMAPFTGELSPGMLLAAVFLVQAWGPFGQSFWNAPSWSISCEAFAYIAFALTAPWRPLSWRPSPLIVLAFAVVAYVYAAITADGLEHAFYGPPAILRGVSGFFLGAVTWEVVSSPRWEARFAALSNQTLTVLQLATVAALIALLPVLDGPRIIIALVPLLLLPLLHMDRGVLCDLLNTRPMQYLGKISYSVYMVHYFILLSTDSVLKRALPASRGWANVNSLQGTLFTLGLVAIVVAVGSVTWWIVEEPGRQFGRRLVGRKPREIADAAAAPLQTSRDRSLEAAGANKD